MDGHAPAPIPLQPTRRAPVFAPAPAAILAGTRQQAQTYRAAPVSSRFECAGPLAMDPFAACRGHVKGRSLSPMYRHHVRGRSASPMYSIKSAQMLPTAAAAERQTMGSIPAVSSTAKVSTSPATAQPSPAARSSSSPPAQNDSAVVKKALDVYRAFVPPLAEGVSQAAGPLPAARSLPAAAGASPVQLTRSLRSQVPVPVQIAIHVSLVPRDEDGSVTEFSSTSEATVSKLATAMDIGDSSDATRASGALDSCAGSSTPTNAVPNSPPAPDGRCCMSSASAFKRQLSTVEVAHVKDMLSRPSGLHQLHEGTWKEFSWALAGNGHVSGKPGCLDYPRALTVLRQLVYLNGLPALDVEATTQFLNARASRVGSACSSSAAAIGPDELHEALLDLLRAAVNFQTGTVSELTSVGSKCQSDEV